MMFGGLVGRSVYGRCRWGLNDLGQLGFDDSRQRMTPTAPNTMRGMNYAHLAAGAKHAGAVRNLYYYSSTNIYSSASINLRMDFQSLYNLLLLNYLSKLLLLLAQIDVSPWNQ
jgi:hypothetical protein